MATDDPRALSEEEIALLRHRVGLTGVLREYEANRLLAERTRLLARVEELEAENAAACRVPALVQALRRCLAPCAACDQIPDGACSACAAGVTSALRLLADPLLAPFGEKEK